MRMWMCDPAIMCRQHLLGEHRELHALVGTIRVKKSLQGYINNKLIETASIQARHDALVAEMKNRNYPGGLDHKSPLSYKDALNLGVVPRDEALAELIRRCPECEVRYRNMTSSLTVLK